MYNCIYYSQEDTWETEACYKVDDLLESFMGIRDTELGKHNMCTNYAEIITHFASSKYTTQHKLIVNLI